MRRSALLALASLALAGCGTETSPPPRSPDNLLFDAVVALVYLLLIAGVGCAAAVLGAAFPAIARANDRTARAAGSGTPMVVGALVVVGTLAALSALSKTDATATAIALVLLALPTALLWLAGLTACAPLLGERLGAGATASSPLRRSVVASLAVGFAVAPALVTKFLPATVLLGLVVFGWPTGVGLLTASARLRRREPPPPPPAPPTP